MTSVAAAAEVVGVSIGVLVVGASSAVAIADMVGSSAKPFNGLTEAELNSYIDRTWKRFVVLPHYDEEIHWDVYLLYKSFFGHYSVLFVTPGHIEGFLIHLTVLEDNRIEFLVDTKSLRLLSHDQSDLNALSLGTTNKFTAKYIITKAHDRLVKMGRYHTILNNCQHYCRELASEILVTNICELWGKELIAILQGAIEAAVDVAVASAVAAGTAVESGRCMQRIGPQTGSSPIKPIKNLYDYYNATTGRNV